jgi:hypothetical protein
MKAEDFLTQESAESFLDDLEPKPTGAVEMHRKAPGGILTLRKALPIAGDIVATALPIPAGKIKPMTALGKWGLKTIQKSMQSGVGGASGELLAQKLYGEDFNTSKIFQESLWSAVGESSARTIAPAMKPLFKWASSLTMLGSGLKEAWRHKLINKTTQRAAKFIQEFAPDVVQQQGKIADIGELSLRVNEAVDEYKAAYDIFSDHIDKLAKGKEGGVLLDDTQQLFGEFKEKWSYDVYEKFDRLYMNLDDLTSKIEEVYGYAPNSKQSLFLRRAFDEEVVDANDLKDFFASIFKKGNKSDWGQILPSQREARNTLKETIKNDIAKNSATAKEAKEYGDKVFGEIANFRKIQKIFNNPRALRQMPSGDLYLNPTALANEIQKNKKIISDISPGLWERLNKEAKFYRSMAENWRPPKKRSVILGTLGMGGVGSGATLLFAREWLPVVEGFGTFSAWMTLSPTSRKVLGEVVKNAVIKPAAHIGGGMTFPINFQAMGME